MPITSVVITATATTTATKHSPYKQFCGCNYYDDNHHDSSYCSDKSAKIGDAVTITTAM